MANKRQATTNLNHENWDQDDPSEQEEMGTFACAPKDVLEKRVIRTAKRRVQTQASGDEVKKSVFSGFGGFNKSQPASFDFLANLTNGNKANGTAATASKSEAVSTSSGLFSSNAATSSPNNSFFGMPTTSSPTSKPLFGIPNTQSSLFGGAATNTATTQSPFAIKTQVPSTDSPFKIPKSTNPISNTSNATNKMSSPSEKQSSSMNSDTSVFKMFKGSTATANTESKSEKKSEDKSEDKKLSYYSKLKGLNESVSDWIKKHVEETPLCILSPIFKDYEKYLKEIQDEYETTEEPKQPSEEIEKPKPIAKTTETVSSLFSNSNNKPSIFGGQTTKNTLEQKSSFSFEAKTSTNTATITTASGGFSFGSSTMISTTAATNPSPFSLNTSTASTGPNGGAPFSFGIVKPFSFSSNIQKPTETTDTATNEEEDEPPKVEFKPIVEENSVFDKRVKVFVKKDGNFVDKGVGTLYIKKVDDSDKHQLLVRANTNLGNVLLNLILASGIPLQRLGKNNVMMVCIPTPDSKPPPTSVLIRVKTAEEADDLLETLNKFKA